MDVRQVNPDADCGHASKKRQALALYINFLVFAGFYEPAAWMARETLPLSNWFAALAVFAMLVAIAWTLKIHLPGSWALGIGKPPGQVVEPMILARERWWTILIGTLLVLEGAKKLVRWTEGLPIAPLLGPATPQWLAATAISGLGAASVVAGVLILRTRWMGAMIGICVFCIEGAATLTFHAAYRNWAGAVVAARREMRGLPVRDGEVEMMQALVSYAFPVVAVAGLIGLIAVAARFKAGERVGAAR